MNADAVTAASPPGWRSWWLSATAVLGLLLLLAAVLVSLRLEKALSDLVEARAVLVGRQVVDVAEGGLRFGVPLAGQTETARKIQALMQGDARLRHLSLRDENGRVAGTPPATGGAVLHVDSRQVQRLLARKASVTAEPLRKVWLSGGDLQVLMQVRDAAGVATGVAWVVYSAEEPQTAFFDSLRQLVLVALALGAGVSLVLGALLWRLARAGARSLQALEGRADVVEDAAWPVLPLPQAWRTLARLERELPAAAGGAGGGGEAADRVRATVIGRWSIGMTLGVAAALAVAAVLALTLAARDVGAARLAATLEGNTAAISSALRIRFERALAVGVPMDGLVGVEPVFREQLERHREIAFFALLDAQQQPLVRVSSPALAAAGPDLAGTDWAGGSGVVTVGGERFRMVRTPIQASAAGTTGAESGPVVRGWLLSGYPENFISRQINALATDLLVAVLVAVILALEWLRFAGRRQGWGRLIAFRAFVRRIQQGQLAGQSPLSGADALGRVGRALNHRLAALRERARAALAADKASAPPAGGDTVVVGWVERHGLLAPEPSWQGRAALSTLRMVVFLTVLSDELVRPFLAVHASQLNGPLGLTPEVLAGIPLSTFLLTWALSQPFGASLLQRFGARRCLMAATAMVGATLLGTAGVTDWSLLTVLRGLTGVAFGFVLIFAQTLMLRVGQASGRGAAIGEFVGAVVAAGIIGPVIGGLMVVKLGAPVTLAAAGLFAASAWWLARRLDDVPGAASRGLPLSWASLRALLRHHRLLALLLCSAIPGKMAATAVLLLVIPLTVLEWGEPAALTGRLLLLYFLAFWVAAGWAGRLSDRIGSRKRFVVAGGLVSALGCAAGFLLDGVWGLVLLGSLLGLGQAVLSSPQIVWATQMADQQPRGTDSEVVLGVYRLVERFGGAAGPLVVASLIGFLGLRDVLLVLGALLALGSVAVLVGLPSFPDAGPEEET